VIPIRFLPAAEAELLHETAYYSHVRAGLGIRFKNAVGDAVDRAARTPAAGAQGFLGTRRLRVAGFPFSVFYRHTEREVLIVALAPDRKRPGYWRRRIV